ncbi:lanthionine synthetase C family protein [Actinacidiphila glaucinigra]|uniref:Lanthionine synthetase C-like protein n=1 Tax=Actinacidiphila glaucinigra TaxID=235986 RepID=A0A239LSR8_9ACTN|nr:lanthionine synthetase C family protein [Actinacidiphila glaucinigra]SNT33491.1 Lanthionine synthetase C-like protein [Actinacidiphila glaucinigra]
MTEHPALALADAVATELTDPATAPLDKPAVTSHRQSLAHGLPGIALLHIERAAAGRGPWQHAHTWLTAAASTPLTSGPDSHPFYGAPALAHALACAAEHLPNAYASALDALDQQMRMDVARRLDTARRRLDAGDLPALAEFDAIRGLAGYGAYLLRRPGSEDALRAILEYCVHLTEPITHDGASLPGWWTPLGPSGRLDERFPGGHANNGMAHGVGGVLALLALAARRGHLVEGHHHALRTILAWLDQWQHNTGSGPSWPYWVTQEDMRTGELPHTGSQRLSWCYGTAGIARAQQLAALTLGDTARQVVAEHALSVALHEPSQLRHTTDPGMCHGVAGLAHIAARALQDAHASTRPQLLAVLPTLLDVVHSPQAHPTPAAQALLHNHRAGAGFLDGAAGIALALLAPTTGSSPRTAWDACLLLG